MNTIEFLISSTNKYSYFNMTDDLNALIHFFDPNTFKDSLFPFKAQEFLGLIHKDMEKASLKEVTFIADYLLKFVNLDNKPLLDVLRDEVKNYMIRHPEELDIRKYFKIIVSSVVKDLQKDLDLPIRLSYKNDGNFFKKTYAEVFDGYNNHDLSFNENLDMTFNNSTLIFRIYQYLYHEQFHLIVKELANNPLCYKVDILKYAMVHTFRDVEFYERNSNEFYRLYYDVLKEENNAELFGIKKAKEKILEINPNFKVSMLVDFDNKEIMARAKENSLGVLESLGKDKLISQDDYLEQLLDSAIKKYPEHLEGITKKMYNSDGSRKDIDTLIGDFRGSLENDKIKNKEDVKEFYYYLIYRLIRNMNKEELDNLLNREDINIIKESLIANSERLNKEIDNITGNKLYYMMGLFSRKINIKLLLNEREEIQSLLELIQERRLEGENYNGRR